MSVLVGVGDAARDLEPGHRAVSVRLGAAHRCPDAARRTTGRLGARSAARGRAQAPTWWVVFSAGLFVWGLLFLVLFPGFGGFPGLLGWTSTGKLERETAANAVRLESTLSRIRGVPVRDTGARRASDIDRRRSLRGKLRRLSRSRRARQPAPGIAESRGRQLAVRTTTPARSSPASSTGEGCHAGPRRRARSRGRERGRGHVLSLNGYQAPADWIAAGKVRFESCASPVTASMARATRRSAPRI